MEIDYKQAFKDHLNFHFQCIDSGIRYLKTLTDDDEDTKVEIYIMEEKLHMLNHVAKFSYDIALELFPEKKEFIDFCRTMYMQEIEKRASANRNTNTPE